MIIRIIREDTQPFEAKTKDFLEYNVKKIEMGEFAGYLNWKTGHYNFNFTEIITEFLQSKLAESELGEKK